MLSNKPTSKVSQARDILLLEILFLPDIPASAATSVNFFSVSA
jgi:hypothetical protein